MTYEDLLIESEKENLIVKEKDMAGYKGRICGNRIAIRKNLTSIEKSCILAEELGHFYTTAGDIRDQSHASNRKQELHARLWGYNQQVGLLGIIKAYKARRTSQEDMAEFLGVTPEYLLEALEQYRSKYSPYIEVDNYVIFFEPNLAVMEKLKECPMIIN